MDRNEKILYLCNLSGKGLEIGPSFSPVVSKKDGYDIEIIDHLDKQGLTEKYTGHGVDLNKIEEVDYIWNGESYTELTGKTNYYDYIIASHVIEHTCDLISFLNDCAQLLKDNGILSLVIPDKRCCFDYFRPITGIAKVIDSFLSRESLHSPGIVCEYVLSAVSINEHFAWDSLTPLKSIKFHHSIEDAKRMLDESISSKAYIDAHQWVFTKSSFELLVYDLNHLGFITSLEIVKTFDTVGCEFYVSLKKTSRGVSIPQAEQTRVQLLLNIKGELESNYRSRSLPLQKTSQIIKKKLRTCLDYVSRDLLGSIFIEGWAFIENVNSDETNAFIEICDIFGNTETFSTIKKERVDVSDAFGEKQYSHSGFVAVIALCDFDVDIQSDKIKIYVEHNGKFYSNS